MTIACATNFLQGREDTRCWAQHAGRHGGDASCCSGDLSDVALGGDHGASNAESKVGEGVDQRQDEAKDNGDLRLEDGQGI